MNELKKGLYIISTPIGNLDDISLRAKKILQKVDFIIVENPKHALKLLNKLGIKKKLLSLHDYNEVSLIKKINKYQNNSLIAPISDSGSPLISDPGFNLVKDYIDKKFFVTSVPGPSSIIPSLQLSGLAVNNFIFFGFVPKNQGPIISLIKRVEEFNLTSVFYISGNRLQKFLELLLKNSMNRKIAICKELTKINEKIIRGNVDVIINKILNNEINLRGEFTIVVDNKKLGIKKILDESVKRQANKLLKKYTLTETVEIVHKLTNISKKDIYSMALKLKKND